MSARLPLPPFTRESAIQKVRMAEDGWNLMLAGIRSRHPETAGDEKAFRRAVLAHLQRYDPAGYGWVRIDDV